MKSFRDKINKFVNDWRSENSALSIFSNSNINEILMNVNYSIDINSFIKILNELDIMDDSAQEEASSSVRLC